jgi:hypothetical protein
LPGIEINNTLHLKDSMRNYFYGGFLQQIEQLSFSRPNHVLRSHLDDDSLVFFGGRDWCHVSNDLARIPLQDRARFVLSLFMVTLTDQCLHCYMPAAYAEWRSKTKYPKFGWAGFGVHYENPFKLLWAPEREQLVNPDEVIELMPVFTRFLMTETVDYFARMNPVPSVVQHFQGIQDDEAYRFNEGRTVQALKRELDKEIKTVQVA